MARVSAFDRGRKKARSDSNEGALPDGMRAVPSRSTLGPQPNIFSGLTPSQVEIVTSCSDVCKLKKGDLLFLQGAPHSGVFIIQTGIIRTFFVAPKGREITFAYWRAGNLVGTPEV